MKILFRREKYNSDEFLSSTVHFDSYTGRMQISPNSTVIGRYSVLPYYKELSDDLQTINSKLINSPIQHEFIANIFNWSDLLSNYTPRTYSADNWYSLPDGPYVLKGTTNSMKNNWFTHMYCGSKQDIPKTLSNLMSNPLIDMQGIVLRDYVELKKIGESIHGAPITNEHRTFWLGNNLVSHGYYWANQPETFHKASITPKAISYAREIAEIVSQYTNFFVLDIAEKENGEWMLIEINDGQMSGLATINHDDFYRKLRKVSEGFEPL